jgi:hypothetical protein
MTVYAFKRVPAGNDGMHRSSAGHYRIDRADPAIRLLDYQQALRFWLSYPDPRTRRILFIENSGYPLDSLEAIAASENPLRKVTEFISLNCNWYPETSHYGYAEMRMLDLGLQQSRLRRETTHMIKITGRLTFPALSKLLDHVPASFDFVADARAWLTPWKKHRVPFVGTQLILFSHDFYLSYLQTQYDRMAESYQPGRQRPLLETFFYRALTEQPQSAGHPRLLRFPCSVDPLGQPAHRSRSYSHPAQRVTNAFRAGMRRIAPGWWL